MLLGKGKRKQVTVYLDPDQVEWIKEQDWLNLSGFVREEVYRLMKTIPTEPRKEKRPKEKKLK